MRLFRPKYRDKKGKKKQVAKWWLEFRDPNGTVQRWGLGITDEQTAKETMNLYFRPLVEHAKTHIEPPPEIVKWVRRQEPKLREKIYNAGLLPAGQTNLTKPLTEHLEDYRNALSINSKDHYVRQTINRIQRIIDGCGFKFWVDVDGIKINDYVLSRCENGNGRHTGHAYIVAFRLFANWMKKQKRITETPEIASMKYEKAERRAFEYDEWDRLLEATQKGPVRSCMIGYERYVLYNLTMEHGLRLKEAAILTPLSFNLTEDTIFIKGTKTDTSNAKQNMTPETAALVKDLIKDMMPNTKLFHLDHHAAEMLRKDCEAAGIETTNWKGTIVFHSLRHTCATFLLNKGLDIKSVQARMRHAKVETTLKYTHLMIGSDRNATNIFGKIKQNKSKIKTA